MSLPDKIKAIVLTCDRYHVITRHMIYQYDRLWPNHPFVFHIPYQKVGGTDTKRTKYFPSPSDIKGTVLHLLSEIDDEEWIYWCVDDKYPIQLPVDKVARKLDRVFVVDAPVNPLFVIDFREQMQDCSLDVRG